MKYCSVLFLVMFAGSVAARSPLPADRQYQELVDDFLAAHYAQRPLEAVALGWHQYDGQFANWDATALAAEKQRLKKMAAAFAALRADRLSATNRQDLQLLRVNLASLRWKFETQRAYALNPMTYASALDVLIYFTRDFAPLSSKKRVHVFPDFG